MTKKEREFLQYMETAFTRNKRIAEIAREKKCSRSVLCHRYTNLRRKLALEEYEANFTE